MRRITANQFWSSFTKIVGGQTPAGLGELYTSGMYAVLHRVQSDLGKLWCQCRYHPRGAADGAAGERLSLDFAWFSAESADDWQPILVAIEHENLWSDLARSVDHWKVNQVATPLRVFFGYVSNSQDPVAAAESLMRRETRWTAVDGGESLIVIKRNAEDDPFRAWASKQGCDEWRPLHDGAG